MGVLPLRDDWGLTKNPPADTPLQGHHGALVPRLSLGGLLVGAGRKPARKAAAMLAACIFILIFFPGHPAEAKGKSLKAQLKHALVGHVVTSRILLGNRARPDDLARQNSNIDFPVHTLVDADTSQIVYRIEDPLLLEWATVDPSEMLRSFDPGTSFRISSVHFKSNRIEIKLKKLGGQSAEVKLMMGKGWQSRYNAAAVEASLARIFAFGEPRPQPTMAQQARPPVKPDVPLSDEAPSVSQPVMQPAYVDCQALNQVSLFATAEAPAPIAELRCGEKVTAMGKQNGRVKVRTEKNVEGYVSQWFLAYGNSPSSGQAAGEEPAVPEKKLDSPAATSTSIAAGEATQDLPSQETEQQPSASVAPGGQLASATGDATQGTPAQETEPQSSTYETPTRQAGSAASPSGLKGYWPLLIAACFGFFLVVLALRRGGKVEDRKKDEPRKGERRKGKRREETMGNQRGKASGSARRSYGNVAAGLAGLAKTCGPQIAEMARATMAVGGVDFSGKGPADFLFFDAVRILSTVSKTKERVPARLTGLCRSIHRRLHPGSFPEWDVDTVLDNARSESFEIDLPFTVTLLAGYDQMQGTHLAQRAAEAYWELVCAACEIMDSKSGVATKIVRDTYLKFFRPYLSANGDDGASSEGSSRSATGSDNGTSGFGECSECAKSYETLDVSPNATREEIKTAYRDLAKIFHSDRLRGAEERVQRKAEERLKEINLAYGHISSHWASQEE